MDRLLTPKEAALILGISEKQVRNLLRRDNIHGQQPAKYQEWLIKESEVSRYAAQVQGVRVSPICERASELPQQCIAVTPISGFERVDLEFYGFLGFVKVAQLKQHGCSMIPKENGIYVVVRETHDVPVFLLQSVGGHFKLKDPTVGIDDLQRNWVQDAYVLYIGKAGGTGMSASLRGRIRMYINFGKGRPAAHAGGRLIWQLQDCDDLLVAWKPLKGEEPGDVENYLLKKFCDMNKGTLPFANLKL